MVALVLMQLIRPVRNESAGQVSAVELGKVYDMPETVERALRVSCYDCHSDHTDYPWYAEIQPIGWFLADHIKKGRRELNFDRFGQLSNRQRQSKLRMISKKIETGEMPLASYTAMHSNAKLNLAEKKAVLKWIDSEIEKSDK